MVSLSYRTHAVITKDEMFNLLLIKSQDLEESCFLLTRLCNQRTATYNCLSTKVLEEYTKKIISGC